MTRAAQLLARRLRSSPMCSRIDISPAGLARGRRGRRSCNGWLRPVRLLGGGAPLALVGRGRLADLVLVVVPGGLGHALLELLDAEADVAAHGRKPAGAEEHDDRDDDPDPLRPWHCPTPSHRQPAGARPPGRVYRSPAALAPRSDRRAAWSAVCSLAWARRSSSGVRRSLRDWTAAARALRLATIRQTVQATVISTASQKTPSRMASQSGRVTSGRRGRPPDPTGSGASAARRLEPRPPVG